jgi:hypothetical protein
MDSVISTKDIVFDDDDKKDTSVAPSKLEQLPLSTSDLSFEEEPSTLSDLGTGAAQGLTFGFSDEALAALRAAHNVATTEKTIKDLPSLYRQLQQLEQEKVRKAKEASPYAYFAGELGGGVLPALFTGGGTAAARGATAVAEGAKAASFLPSVVRGAKLGAGYGALAGAGTSEAGIEDTAELAKDIGKGVLGGGTFGAVAGAAGDLVKKGIEAAGENRTLRQMGVAFAKGEEGVPLHGDSALEEKLAAMPAEAGSEVALKLKNAKDVLGQRIKDILETNKDFEVLADPGDSSHVSDVLSLLETRKNLFGGSAKNQRALSLVEKFESDSLTPTEARDLKNILKQTAHKYRQADPEVYDPLSDFAESLTQKLNKIPGFQDANQNYTQFLKSAQETLLSGGTPIETLETFLSDAPKANEKLAGILEDIIRKVEQPGSASDKQRTTLYEMLKNLKNLEAQKPGLLKEIGFDPDKVLKQIREAGDVYATSTAIRGYEPHLSPVKSVLGSVTPRGTAYKAAEATGKLVSAAKRGAARAEKTLPGKLSKEAFTWSSDKLGEVAQKLLSSSDKKLQMLGQGLSGSLEKGGVAPRAVLFTILQSPDARRVIADMYPGVGEE